MLLAVRDLASLACHHARSFLSLARRFSSCVIVIIFSFFLNLLYYTIDPFLLKVKFLGKFFYVIKR